MNKQEAILKKSVDMAFEIFREDCGFDRSQAADLLFQHVPFMAGLIGCTEAELIAEVKSRFGGVQ